MERRNSQRNRDDVYDASEWGHTILWLCILLLTACVVASGGVVTNAAGTNAGADQPAQPVKVEGRFTDGRLTLVLSGPADHLTGTATLNGKNFPVKATAKEGQVAGSFVSDGNAFPFTATVTDNRMRFTTGQTTYDMTKETPTVPNPLAAPVDAAKESPVSFAAPAPDAATTSQPAAAAAQPAPAPAVAVAVAPAAPPARPMLRVRQGQYFRWPMPEGWQCNETTNGVDIAAPDGRAGASSELLVGAPGNTTPKQFVETFLPQCGIRNLNFIATKDLPDQNYAGMPMKVTQMELTYDLNGTPFHGLTTCAIVSGWNQYTAFVQSAGAVPEQWEQLKTWLPAIAEGVVITNPRQVALQDRIILPKNRPLDDSSIMSSWEAKNRSEDRISQKREETTLGYERMKDTSTGEMYDMPFERYDATRGGYVNPQRPTELLEHAQPGE